MSIHPPTALVLMGVSGAGKTTVGLAASALTGVPFRDADELHPAANVAKMAAGVALDDDDRAPWLDAVGAALRDDSPCIMACSALRRSYRDRLRQHAPGTLFVLLQVPRTELERRTAGRDGHFMPAALLDSQLATLESPDPAEGIVVLDATQPIEALATEVARLLDSRVD